MQKKFEKRIPRQLHILSLFAVCFSYDAERLSNNMTRTRPLDVAANPFVEEGYFAKLTNSNSGVAWGNRQENTTLRVSTKYVCVNKKTI